MKSSCSLDLERVLKKAIREEPLCREELLYLLGLEKVEEKEKVFEVARQLRSHHFGRKIFLYGFIYFSTWCRNDCFFCQYRCSHVGCDRYRRRDDEILKAANDLAASGVHLLDLTMGEDPQYYLNEEGFEPLLLLLQTIKRATRLPLMVSWGVMQPEAIRRLPRAGTDWFACYQETHNRELFQRLRLGQDYDHRLQAKGEAKEAGLLIEEGILSGVGESSEDIVDSMEAIKRISALQVRVMNFVPQKGTPMGRFMPPPPRRESLIISVLRLYLPNRLIPASLDVYGIEGLKEKLEAGANVITSLIPPGSDLRGVVGTLGISEGQRTAKAVMPILKGLGLRAGSSEDYISWMEEKKVELLFGKPFQGKDRTLESRHCWGKAAGC
jgi:methylornithine synthase